MFILVLSLFHEAFSSSISSGEFRGYATRRATEGIYRFSKWRKTQKAGSSTNQKYTYVEVWNRIMRLRAKKQSRMTKLVWICSLREHVYYNSSSTCISMYNVQCTVCNVALLPARRLPAPYARHHTHGIICTAPYARHNMFGLQYKLSPGEFWDSLDIQMCWRRSSASTIWSKKRWPFSVTSNNVLLCIGALYFLCACIMSCIQTFLV